MIKFAQYLYPRRADPDLIIRTSGEERLSGFYCGKALTLSFISPMCLACVQDVDFWRALRIYQRERLGVSGPRLTLRCGLLLVICRRRFGAASDQLFSGSIAVTLATHASFSC